MLLVRAPGAVPSLTCNAIDDCCVRIKTIHAAPTAVATTTATRGRRSRRRRRIEASSGLSMAMKGRPAPQLSEEELTAMGSAREKVMLFFVTAVCRTNRGRNVGEASPFYYQVPGIF